eukprot:PhM_4_TR19073/c1_g1_i2/m.97
MSTTTSKKEGTTLITGFVGFKSSTQQPNNNKSRQRDGDNDDIDKIPLLFRLQPHRRRWVVLSHFEEMRVEVFSWGVKDLAAPSFISSVVFQPDEKCFVNNQKQHQQQQQLKLTLRVYDKPTGAVFFLGFKFCSASEMIRWRQLFMYTTAKKKSTVSNINNSTQCFHAPPTRGRLMDALEVLEFKMRESRYDDELSRAQEITKRERGVSSSSTSPGHNSSGIEYASTPCRSSGACEVMMTSPRGDDDDDDDALRRPHKSSSTTNWRREAELMVERKSRLRAIMAAEIC